MSLADAVEAAHHGDWHGCLSAVLVAWRLHRQPELADLIDRITVRAAGRAVSAKDFYARFRDASDADVAELITRCAASAGLVDALELAKSRPPDPRLSRLLHDKAGRFLPSDLNAGVVAELERIDDHRYRAWIIDTARLIPTATMRAWSTRTRCSR
jgi:hypothetical protein